MIQCPGCGASLKYDISSAALHCEFCGVNYDPYQFDKMTSDAVEDKMDAAVYHCSSCGAELITDSTDLSVTCSYCGGASLIFKRMEKKLRPESIIPFALTKEEAAQRYLKKARLAVFTGWKYRRKSVVEDFRSIYMPFWSYDVNIRGTAATEKTESRYQDGDYIVIVKNVEQAPLSTTLHGYAHDASRSFDDTISECLAPYSCENEKPFTPGYLCGIYADASDMPSEKYDDDAKEQADLYTANRIIQEIDPKASKVTVPDKHHVRAHKVLFPVWFLSIRTGDSISYATVNGRTGKVVADFPMSIPRVIIFSLIIALLLFAGLNTVAMLTPAFTAIVSALLTFVGIFLNWKEHQRLNNRNAKKTTGVIDVKNSNSNYLIIGLILATLCSLPIILSHVTWVKVTSGIMVIAFAVGGGLLTRASNSKNTARAVRTNLFAPERLFSLITVGVMFFSLFPVALCMLSRTATVIAIHVLEITLFGLSIYINFINPNSSKKKNRIIMTAILTCMSSGTFIVLIGKPVNIYYYFWSISCTLVFLFFFISTIRYHAEFCRRRPPQFDKGGRAK